MLYRATGPTAAIHSTRNQRPTNNIKYQSVGNANFNTYRAFTEYLFSIIISILFSGISHLAITRLGRNVNLYNDRAPII